MTKRICPSCGLGAYSADTVTTWICSNCGAEIAPRCEVEIERCKPDRLNEIRERAEKATPGPWKMKLHRENYGQGYGATTYFVDMDGALLKIGLAEDAKECAEYYALAQFVVHAREDIPFLLNDITWLRAELDAANKRAEAAVWDMKSIADKINGCEDFLSGGKDKVKDLQLGRCSVCQRACESGDGCHFEWRGTEAQGK